MSFRRRAGRCIDRHLSSFVAVYLVVLTAAIGFAFSQNQSSDSTNESRDAARTFQRCVQTAELVDTTNQLIRRGNRVIGSAAGRIDPAPAPDCDRLYPRGKRETARFPDAAPVTYTRRTDP